MKRLLMLFMCAVSISFAEEHQSAATKRQNGINSQNELYTRFRYKPIKGLGYEPGINRRDPSSIIKVDGKYYVWYTRNQSTTSKWLDADIWYATSPDGINWKEQGPAVKRGPEGAYDDYSVFTCNILVAEGKYYLCYQAETKTHDPATKTGCGINVVGMAKADSPDGPWTYAHEGLLLTPEIDDSNAWDHLFVANPRIEYFNGKWFIYYKGKGLASTKTLNGVATSDNLLGPYTKYSGNPLMGGHSANLVKYKNGLIYMNYHKHAFYWTEDGFTFTLIKRFGKGTGMAEELNWSSFWQPNNPLHGGDPPRPYAAELWGVSSRWAYPSEGYRKAVVNAG